MEADLISCKSSFSSLSTTLTCRGASTPQLMLLPKWRFCCQVQKDPWLAGTFQAQIWGRSNVARLDDQETKTKTTPRPATLVSRTSRPRGECHAYQTCSALFRHRLASPCHSPASSATTGRRPMLRLLLTSAAGSSSCPSCWPNSRMSCFFRFSTQTLTSPADTWLEL